MKDYYPRISDELFYTSSAPEIDLIQAIILRAIYDCCLKESYIDNARGRSMLSQYRSYYKDAMHWIYSDSMQEWSFLWCVEQVVPEGVSARSCVKTIRLRLPHLQKEYARCGIHSRNAFVRRS